MSPLVLMMAISKSSSVSPWAAISRSRNSCAWASASLLPRVPMRIGSRCLASLLLMRVMARTGIAAQPGPWSARDELQLPRARASTQKSISRTKRVKPHEDMRATKAELNILGIETSCDETGAAVVWRASDGRVRNPGQSRALAARGACRFRRCGARDRRARACRGAGRH